MNIPSQIPQDGAGPLNWPQDEIDRLLDSGMGDGICVKVRSYFVVAVLG
jgi:hypothetical protein